MNEIVAKSYVGKLFTADFSKEKNLTDALLRHVGHARELLEAAILVVNEGVEGDEKFCRFCYNAGELLGAYKDAIRIGLDRVEVEMMSRKKGKAA